MTVEDHENNFKYDTDSFKIYIDNCCSRSMTFNKNDFVTELIKDPANVKGFVNASQNLQYKGTVSWKIDDDNGLAHEIHIPNTYYSPKSKYRLLSPQHWSQTEREKYGMKHTAHCVTWDDKIELYWDHNNYKQTVPLYP